MVDIVSLWGKNQVPRELGISIDPTDAMYNVPEMKLERFISNVNVLTLEWWAAGQTINHRIEFVCGMVREAKPLYKLKLHLATQHGKKKKRGGAHIGDRE